jgi:hypothetical protein
MREEDEGDEGEDKDEGNEGRAWTAETDDTAQGSRFGDEALNSARDMRGGPSVSLARIGADAGANCGLPDVRDTGRVSGAVSQRLSREQSRFSHSKKSPPPRASGLPAPNAAFPDARRSSLASGINGAPLNSDRSHLGVHEVVVEEDEDDEDCSSSTADLATAEVGAVGGSVLRTQSPRRSNSFDRLNSFGRTRVSSGSTGPGLPMGAVATRL